MQPTLDARRAEISNAVSRLIETSDSHDDFIRRYNATVMRDPALCGSYEPGSRDIIACLEYSKPLFLAGIREVQQRIDRPTLTQSATRPEASSTVASAEPTVSSTEDGESNGAKSSADSSAPTNAATLSGRTQTSADTGTTNLNSPPATAANASQSSQVLTPTAVATKSDTSPSPGLVPAVRTESEGARFDWSKLTGDAITILVLAAIVSFFALLILGATNKVVIFSNWIDLVATLCGIFAFPVFVAIGSLFELDLLRYAFILIGAAMSLALIAMSFWTAIRFNNNLAVGILVGVFKLLCSLLGIVFLLDLLGKIFGRATGFKGTVVGIVLLAVLGWVSHRLVNGASVMAARANASA